MVAALAAQGASLLAKSGPVAGHREPGYREGRLENGLRVVLIERREVPMVCATAVVGSGSAYEAEGFSGAAHFLEHLLFDGTSTMTQEQLYDAVDRIGGYNNAHTEENDTVFTMLVPAKAAQAGLEIQAAMLFDSVLEPAKMETERKIVLEELARDRSAPDWALEEALRSALAPGSAYGRPILGTYESLGAITRDRVFAYYKERYVPANVLLAVMGDFDADTMWSLVASTYGGVAAGKTPPGPPDAGGSGGGALIATKVEGETAAIVLQVPAPGPLDPLGSAAPSLAAVLGSESGPLRRALDPAVVASVGASYVPRPGGSVLSIRLDLVQGAATTDVVLRQLLDLLDGLARASCAPPGFEPESIARVTRSERASDLLLTQRIHYFGMTWAPVLAACGEDLFPLLAPSAHRDVAPGSVMELARNVFAATAAKGRVAIVGPDQVSRGPIPISREGAVPIPCPEAPARSVVGAEVDRVLPNGLRVLAAREPGGQITAIHLLVRDRAACEPAGREGIADVLHRMLPLGTRLSDRPSFAARLERLGAELKTADSDEIPYDDYYTSPSHSFVRLEVPAAEWLPALDLVAEMVRLPVLDASELGALRDVRIARARKLSASPRERASLAYRQAMLGAGHVLARALGGTPESLAAIQREDLQSFAASYLDPRGLIVSVVGPQDAGEMLGAVAERFAAASTATARPTIPAWPITGDAGPPVEVQVGADQSEIHIGRVAPLDAGSRPAMVLMTAVLSDRLSRRVRETDGLAYSVGASVELSADRAWLTVAMGTRPENVEKAIASTRAEMARLASEAVPDAELARIRASCRSRSLMRRMSAINRARALALEAFTGIAGEDDVGMLDAMDAVDARAIARAAADWLKPDGMRVVIAR